LSRINIVALPSISLLEASSPLKVASLLLDFVVWLQPSQDGKRLELSIERRCQRLYCCTRLDKSYIGRF
jgi:hypothetical protein